MLVLISLCGRVSGAAQGCAGSSPVHTAFMLSWLALLDHAMPEPWSSESVLLGMPYCVTAVDTCRADCLYC